MGVIWKSGENKSWFVDFEPFKDGEFVESGSQRAWHRVMIVRFDSFRFGNGSNSYSLAMLV